MLPERSVQTVVTSPPYWSLRDYEVDRQIGRDDPLNDYLASIVETFEKLRRVLTDDGTVLAERRRRLYVGKTAATARRTARIGRVPWRCAQ